MYWALTILSHFTVILNEFLLRYTLDLLGPFRFTPWSLILFKISIRYSFN